MIQLTADPEVPGSHLYMEAQIFTPDSRRLVLHRSATAHGGSKSDPNHQYLRCDLDDVAVGEVRAVLVRFQVSPSAPAGPVLDDNLYLVADSPTTIAAGSDTTETTTVNRSADLAVDAWRGITRFIEEWGAVPGIQLAHAGRKACAPPPDEGEPLRARLAVVADGTGTAVDGIVRERHDYGQVALVGEVFLDPPRHGVAYERFTPDGPVALLPERDHHGLVWTMTPAIAEAMLALPERAFLDGLARHFGTRVTGFAHAAGRRAFPLVLERARPVVTARAAVIGNAAQQLHPVAGQGFNLGLRDAWELARTILDAPRDAVGGGTMLAAYASRRRVDRGAGIAFTHGLVRIFGNDVPLARWSRGLALALLDVMPPAKRAFTRAMLHGMH